MKFKYKMIIDWREEDQAYIAEVPELLGCMADSANYEEAVKNAELIIAEWLETANELKRDIAQPNGHLLYS